MNEKTSIIRQKKRLKRTHTIIGNQAFTQKTYSWEIIHHKSINSIIAHQENRIERLFIIDVTV